VCDPVRWRRRLLVRNLAVLLLLPRWWKLAGSAGKESGESVEQREMQHSGGGDQAKCRRKFRFTSAAVLCIWCYSVPEFSFLALRQVSKADDCSPPYSDGPPWRGDSIGATENAGFSAKLQRNLGRDFVV